MGRRKGQPAQQVQLDSDAVPAKKQKRRKQAVEQDVTIANMQKQPNLEIVSEIKIHKRIKILF